MMKRLLRPAVVLLVVLAACGESGPLDGIGNASRDLVVGDTTTSSTVTVISAGIVGEGLVGSGEVLWLNDEILEEATGSAEAVIESVWGRRSGSRFVQASRAEIASALPTLQFPALLAVGTRWVTSQLVYDLDSAKLDSDTAAAFGMWRVEPYTVTEGRLMVLRVGFAPDGVPPERSDVTPIAVPDGLTLIWTDAGLRYELFCRSNLSEELCFAVSDSFTALGGVLPGEQ